MDSEYRVSVVIPCFGRPQRTRRIMDRIVNQTINNFEIFLIGDGCPDFKALMDSQEYRYWIQIMELKGNRVVSFNYEPHSGGYGYKIINYAIQHARGKYFMFIGNDDVVDNDHLEHYLSEIEETDIDMMYYNTYVKPYMCHRESELLPGSIGHSEIIIKTDVIKALPAHTSTNGNDWDFILTVIGSNKKIKKTSHPLRWTYYIHAVSHMDGKRFDYDVAMNID